MTMNLKKNNNGLAMIIALFLTVIFFGLSALFVFRTFNEANIARVERESAKASYAADGGVQASLRQMDILINNYLLNTISSSNPSGVISYATSKVASHDGIGWLVNAVRNNNVPVLAQNGLQAEYSQTATIGGATYTYNIFITDKTDPVTVSPNIWDFPYTFRVESTGTSTKIARKAIMSGDFTVRVQKDNFAKFALFTNTQQSPAGSAVWFTDKTNFAGPVHTNDRFNFALNPSGTFEASTRQVQQTARFYNGGSPVLLDANNNGTTDVPVFHDTFQRNVSSITLSSSTNEQDMANEAKGSATVSSNGIYVPVNGSSLSGGVYVKGDSTVNLSVDGSNNAVYTIAQGGSTKIITVLKSTQQTTVQDVQAGTTQTYSGMPHGVDGAGTLIYVDGNITSLKGTVQKDTELTVGSKSDIIITDNLKYADYNTAVGTPGQSGYMPPNALDKTNLLGIVTWTGDVRIGTQAPNNVEVHGTILAQSGVFAVDNYTDTGVGSRGIATLLGGFISDKYGAFGQFNGSTGLQISGYGRNFAYDERMEQGHAPPYFPSLTTFIAFTNDLTDKLIWQEGE